jgi:O-antigen ligase
MSSILAQSTFPAVPEARTKKPSKSSSQKLKKLAIPLFLAAHIPLALLMDRSSAIGSLHALATVGVGLWWAIRARRPMERVAYVGAYITGAEVLWRMSEAGVFWEMGKYATTAIFLVTIIRSGNWKAPGLPLLYFALLLPSVAVTLMKEGPVDAKLLISGNMSGPLALMMSAWFFSRVTLSTKQLRTLFVAVIGPTIGVATIAASSTISTSDIAFGNESNFVTSGGFGPNQVSAALALGALLALLCALTDKGKWTFRALMLFVTLWLATQSALTFSRGGLYTAAGGAVLGILYLSREARARIKIVVIAALLFLVVSYVVLPRLDAFTGGALSARFENTNSTGRNTIAQADLQIWAENPVFGVGPGESKMEHAQYYRRIATHTEYTRLLAEHGLFGIAAGLLLFIMAAQRFGYIGRMRDVKAKAMIAPMAVWALLYMVDKAMRLVAPSFAFGLCFVTLRQRRRLVRVIRYEKYQPDAATAAGAGADSHQLVA